MGGCATKPKALNDEDANAPEPVKEAAGAGTVSGAKDVAVAEEAKKVDAGDTVVDRDMEIDGDKTVDEHGNKRQSLSNSFKENERKDSTEDNKKPVDPVKQEEALANQNIDDAFESEPQKHEKTKAEAPVEAKVVEVVPTNGTLVEKATVSPPVRDARVTQQPEEKGIAEEKPAAETQNSEEKNILEKEPTTETQKSEEKMFEQGKPAAESQKSEENNVAKEKRAEERNTVEEKLAAETQILEFPEEQKTEEKK